MRRPARVNACPQAGQVAVSCWLVSGAGMGGCPFLSDAGSLGAGAGAGGEVAGELAAVGALGFELGFGAFGAAAFGVGEGLLGLDLGGVAGGQGVALAGGVVAQTAGLGAGVGFGLPGAGGL